MSNIHTHYDNLKVSRTAPPEVIKAAYKSLVNKYHPDKHNGDHEAEQVMRLLNEAYEVLSDPIQRLKHDQWIEEQEKLNNVNANKFPYRYDENLKQHSPLHKSTAPKRKSNPPISLLQRSKNFVRKIVDFCLGLISWGLILFIIFLCIKHLFFPDANLNNLQTAQEHSELYDSNSAEGSEYEEVYREPAKIKKDLIPEALPYTGYTNRQTFNGVAPLRIKVSEGSHYWVKIENALTGDELASYFIRAGETLNIEVPIGSYEVKYASGKQWYGESELFGTNTSYAKADEILNFRFDGYSYNGYSIELIQQVNGNLETTSISEGEF